MMIRFQERLPTLRESFIGRRLPDANKETSFLPEGVDDFQSGDYWKAFGHPSGKGEFCWMLYYNGAAAIPFHKVIEHEDGTISVPEPGPGEDPNSVLITGGGRGDEWHGFIHKGFWKHV